MVLTLSQGFQDAYAKGRVEPVLIVKITTAGGEQIATFGRSDNLTYPESVMSVTPVSRSLEILTNAIRTGSLSIDFVKDNFFDVLWADRLKNQKVEILIGESSMSEVDFEPFFEGIITSVTPHDDRTTISASEVSELLDDVKAVGTFLGQHPLTILENALDQSGFEPSMKVSADFDPTDAAYTSTISHWNTSAGQYWMSTDRENAAGVSLGKTRQLVNDLAIILGGRMTQDEEGRLRFIQYDSSTAAADSWTNDDIQDFRVIDLHRWLKNRAEVEFQSGVTGIDQPGRYTLSDSTSQTNFKYPGGNDLVETHSFKTGLLNAASFLLTNISDSASSFQIIYGNIHSFCGARWPGFVRGGSPVQPASAKLSASRLGYLQVEDEIIEISGFEIDPDNTSEMHYKTNKDIASFVTTIMPQLATITVSGGGAGRGAKGTTAVAHVGDASTPVFDMTIPVSVAEAVIDRHSNGVPVIEVTTNYSKYNLQIGDFVTITTSRYRAFGKTSLTTSVKWEIIGKDRGLGLGGGSRVKWTLAKATDTGDPAVVQAPILIQGISVRGGLQDEIGAHINVDVGENHIVSGMVVAATSGFGIDVTPGIASSISGRTTLDGTLDLTMNASKDTYISWDVVLGQASTQQTTLGAGTPTLFPGQVFLAKVVTDGSGVTGITDPGRATKALDGDKLVDGTVDTVQIATDAVTNVKMADNSIDTVELVSRSVTLAKFDGVTASAHMGTNQTLTKAADDLVEYDTEDFDEGGNFDPSATNHSFTTPVAGVYQFSAQLLVPSAPNGLSLQLKLYKGGTFIANGPLPRNSSGGTVGLYATGNWTIDALSGSSYNIRVAHNNASDQTASNAAGVSFFSITQLR